MPFLYILYDDFPCNSCHMIIANNFPRIHLHHHSIYLSIYLSIYFIFIFFIPCHFFTFCKMISLATVATWLLQIISLVFIIIIIIIILSIYLFIYLYISFLFFFIPCHFFTFCKMIFLATVATWLLQITSLVFIIIIILSIYLFIYLSISFLFFFYSMPFLYIL